MPHLPTRSLRLASVLAIAVAAPGAARAELIVVGDGEGCTVATLDAALAQARRVRDRDEIRLTRTVAYQRVAAVVDNLDVAIIGGYDDCLDESPSGIVSLDGAGGTTRSVMEIRGVSVVRLRGLEIRGGDENDDSDGGGIDYKGQGSLTLESVHLNGNRAGYGGAIYFKGEGAGASLTIGDVSILQDNQALHNGGGIHLSGRATLRMFGRENLLIDNRAIGVAVPGGNEDGLGGGLYVRAPARADIGSSGLFGSGIAFYANEARLGGALAVVGDGDGHDTTVRLFSAHADAPLRLVDNRAREKGGAIFARSAMNYDELGVPHVCLFDTSLEGNRAPRGGAVQLDTVDSNGFPVGPSFGINAPLCARPGEAVPCAAGRRCSQLVGNRTEHPDGGRSDGGIIEIEEESLEVMLHGFVARDNVGGSLLRRHDGQFLGIDLQNCVIWRNVVSRYLGETESERIGVHQCTISGNTVGREYLFKMDASDDGVRHDTFTNSIIDQPNEIAVDIDGDVRAFGAAHVFTNAPFFGVPASQLRYVSAEDPGMVDPAQGDFRLLTGARAIDYGPYYNDGLAKDLDGGLRNVDRPERNVSGLRDAGALEAQR